MKKMKLLGSAVLGFALVQSSLVLAADMAVKITPDIGEVTVMNHGKKVSITRNQDQKNTVNPAFAKTSRKCPPFCIQPAVLAPGVETIAEVEMLHYLKKMSDGDNSIMVVDSRTPDWVAKGTIPGSVNIPWTHLNPAKGADPISIGEILVGKFGAKEVEGLWDYSNAKTLVMFCNGMWCGQSPNNIKNLLKFGYPSHKIKWYRGGMQDWEILGLSTVKGK
ncbi:MAG: rhodanese-like domain-containing protein [Gammaproteobacteria bacterium]|nr:rhodanese-like domain-containing protein [Gammaproteobacteria bacterium]MDH3889243.1 rhodanese-like domain-containing protein [Gammaproteobacteria bacterium]